MTSQTTIDRMATELFKCGMEINEAHRRAVAIAHTLRLNSEGMTYLQIADSKLLKGNGGFRNDDMRKLAAFKTLAVYICETFDTHISKYSNRMAAWAGLLMWCGMTPAEASAYQKRYDEKNSNCASHNSVGGTARRANVIG